jgi:hypothetical protein
LTKPFGIPVQAQSLSFELQTHPDSPVALEKCGPTMFRSEGKRRLFITLKNVSDRAAATFLFQQAIPGAPRDEIIRLSASRWFSNLTKQDGCQ